LAESASEGVEQFAWDRVVDEHVRVYRETIAACRRPRRMS
jgi:hypothetical protein